MLLYLDDRFADHDTGAHPESPQRIERLNRLLRDTGWTERATCPQWQEASVDSLLEVHDSAYLKHLETLCRQGPAQIEADTCVSRDSWATARRAAGACIDAVLQILDGSDSRAFCGIRPPGHHALPSGPMGFCLLNNVAIAAKAALARGVDRVMIVDWDVHHGNGTQDAFYRDGRVAFFSIHRSPFYPGTGDRDETGSGPGLGWIANTPVPADIGTRDFMDRFRQQMENLADRTKPQLMLISAGFDAHEADPIGSLCLVENDFDQLTRIVRDVADQHCQGRMISLLEGGYHLDHMPQSVLAHLDALAS